MNGGNTVSITTSPTADTATKTSLVREGERCAHIGDIVKIDLVMTPENGFVPESLFDTQGVVTFVLGWGNFLPGLHQLLEGCRSDDVVANVSIDAGWGSRRDDLLFEVSLEKFQKITKNEPYRIGSSIKLSGNIDVLVKEIREQDSIVILDANPPLAGAGYSCSFRVLELISVSEDTFEYHNKEDEQYQVATFALGCFWGAELAFSRASGVVGTKVGYSQGTTSSPTYEEVCEGSTHHRETVMVLYDSSLVSYQDLMDVALERLDQTTSSFELHTLFQSPSDSTQYKNGFYYHTDGQRQFASQYLETRGNRFGIELLQAAKFYLAEEYHQQYLFKGGQSTRKGSKEVIRCYG